MNEYYYWWISAGHCLRNPNALWVNNFEYYVYRALTAWMEAQ